MNRIIGLNKLRAKKMNGKQPSKLQIKVFENQLLTQIQSLHSILQTPNEVDISNFQKQHTGSTLTLKPSISCKFPKKNTGSTLI